jgi:hypothetical protein
MAGPVITRALAAAIRCRFASRPAGERFQHREHSGAVLVDRTCRPHSGHGSGASGSGSLRWRAR